jgi:hypothetical protein
MAKEDLGIKATFDGDLAIQGMAQTITKLEGMVAKMREVNRTSKFADFGKDVLTFASGLGVATSGIGLAQKAVALLGNEWDGIIRKEKEALAASKEYQSTFLDILGRQFAPSQIIPAQAAAKRISGKMPYIGQEEAASLMAAYRAARDEKTTIEQAETAAMLAGKVALPAVRPEWIQNFAKIQELFPETKEIDDIADITVAFREEFAQKAGDISEAMRAARQLEAQGISPETTLAVTWAGLQTDAGTRNLSKVADLVARARKSLKEGPKGKEGRKERRDWLKTDEGKMWQALQEAPAGANIGEWIIERPEKWEDIFGITETRSVQPIWQEGRIAAGRQRSLDAQKQDAAKRTAALKTPLFEQQKLDAENAIAVKNALIGQNEAAQRARVYGWTDEILKTIPPGFMGETERKFIMGAIQIEGRIGEDYSGVAINRLRKVNKTYLESKTRPRYVTPRGTPLGAGGEPYLVPGGEPNPYYNPEAGAMISQLIDRIEKNRNLNSQSTAVPAGNLDWSKAILNSLINIHNELIKVNTARPAMRESE